VHKNEDNKDNGCYSIIIIECFSLQPQILPTSLMRSVKT